MFHCRLLIFNILLNLLAFLHGKCPTGSLSSLNDDSTCYSFISTTQKFLDAEQICVDLQGHLTSVTNGLINAFLTESGQDIFKKTNTTDYWIGGSDLMSAGVWTWTDDAKFGYTSWGPGQPANDPGADCLSVELTDGTWTASNCFGSKPFVCKIPPLPEVKCPSFCDSEWAYFEGSDSCYKTFFSAKWNDAEANCVSYEAHLASIHDNAENSFVAALSRTGIDESTPHQTWIGLFTDDHNANWKWTDGSPVDFYNWAHKQPDNPGKENCVQIFSDRSTHSSEKDFYEKYNNYDCNENVRSYVCKKPSNKC